MRSRKGWGGLPIPAAGEVHWGMKGKVGKMGGFRRRSFKKRPPRGAWVSVHGVNQSGAWYDLNIAQATLLFNMTSADVITGGSQGGVVGYMGNTNKAVITRFEGGIYVSASYEDDPDSTQYGILNHFMMSYLWMKSSTQANTPGGSVAWLASDLDPIKDFGRMNRFRKGIIAHGDVSCFVPAPPHSDTTSAGGASINTAAPLNKVDMKNQLVAQVAKIPFPKCRISLEEGQVLQLIVRPWTMYGASAVDPSGEPMRTPLVYPKFRAFYRY